MQQLGLDLIRASVVGLGLIKALSGFRIGFAQSYISINRSRNWTKQSYPTIHSTGLLYSGISEEIFRAIAQGMCSAFLCDRFLFPLPPFIGFTRVSQSAAEIKKLGSIS